MINSTKSSRKSKASYRKLLEDPRWQDKRHEILERANYSCETCGSKYYLQVHHLRYEQGKPPWDYPSAALRCLCNDCHEKSHGLSNSFTTGRHLEPREIREPLIEVMVKIAVENGYPMSDLDFFLA